MTETNLGLTCSSVYFKIGQMRHASCMSLHEHHMLASLSISAVLGATCMPTTARHTTVM